MKSTFFNVILGTAKILMLTALVNLGCSKKSSSTTAATGTTSSVCTTPGYVWNGVTCVPGTGNTGGSLAFEQWLNVTNMATYHDFLEDLDYCYHSSCNNIQFMSLRIDLASKTFPALGRVAISTGYDYPFVRTHTAYPITGGFEFRVTGMYGTPSWNDLVRVVAIPVDANMNSLTVTVYYNGSAFANGVIYRLPAY